MIPICDKCGTNEKMEKDLFDDWICITCLFEAEKELSELEDNEF
jgi:hypothetical protein